MNSEINNVEFKANRIMQSHLSKRGLRVSQRKLMDTIYELLARNESEILDSIEEKKNYEMKLKNDQWHEKSIKIINKFIDKRIWRRISEKSRGKNENNRCNSML